ncbi:DNA repair protein RecN [Maribacter polysaccharolyticus]|uniref:DNA repair protein RecN n=1 Tax=Maribacter polysaccharolyticus TaxID=3020831 RepID=UPI00237EEEF6|nr:DNA repair protein RecN [Maribacter polysaccharolyticus]MDE3740655.1 DNA repair protein RecN [Maribacter polysaccharolyticus]
MLKNLSIKNYALIDRLNVSFGNGFTCITGETGAGKSILLGGLSLVLGKRADLSTLRNKDEKCIVESDFEIGSYGLSSFFLEHDLDYEEKTIIRREILPSGKSRAFVNDTPVTLGVLSKLGSKLIDIHSQHQTLQLAENEFQFKVIDALAGTKDLRTQYSAQLNEYRKISKELNELVEFQGNAIKEHEYNSFLLKELEEARLKEGMLEELEEQYRQLSNVETIVELLAQGHQLMNDEQVGVMNLLSELKQVSGKLSGFGAAYAALDNRIQSVFIEMDDIAAEVQGLSDQADLDPRMLEEVNAKLQLLYSLQKKHGVREISGLIEIKEELFEKVDATENIEATIADKQKQLEGQAQILNDLASKISKKRQQVIPDLKAQIEEKLALLGMPSARFKIELLPSGDFKQNGKDNLLFLFAANKGTDFGDIKKVASGGELSRIMLTIKSIMAKYENLPTMMFDEIDTGVSGEISNRMGGIMYEMSRNMQIFSITHLPQVASKGDHHFKVYKEDKSGGTLTNMKELSKDERVVELAEMLGGKDLSESAMAHARQLLN